MFAELTLKNMFTSKAEPMVKATNQVHTTKDYFLFKPIDGNRNKNLLHINRLKKSMEKTYLFTVLIVNENYEIIDGQHRFEVIKELGLPLHYIVCRGYGLNEVHVLNQNSKNWTADDYLAGYCRLGYPDYLKYAQFKEKYGMSFTENLSILSGYTSNPGTDRMKLFFTGEFKIGDYHKACEIAEKIKIIGNFYKGYKRKSFVYALLWLFKHENFEFTELVQKLKIQPAALMDCANTQQYISLLEEIYNYRRREKVNLRY